MRKSGCTLAQILLAGQWKSISFLKYLDEARYIVRTTAFMMYVWQLFAG